MTTSVSIAKAKSALSEVVNRAAFGKERVIICRHGKPLAAVVGLEVLEELDRLRAEKRPANLAAIAGQWEGFEEIAPQIEEAYAARQEEQERPVTLE